MYSTLFWVRGQMVHERKRLNATWLGGADSTTLPFICQLERYIHILRICVAILAQYTSALPTDSSGSRNHACRNASLEQTAFAGEKRNSEALFPDS